MSLQFADNTIKSTTESDRNIHFTVMNKDNTTEGTMTLNINDDLEARAVQFIQNNRTTFEELAKL